MLKLNAMAGVALQHCQEIVCKQLEDVAWALSKVDTMAIYPPIIEIPFGLLIKGMEWLKYCWFG